MPVIPPGIGSYRRSDLPEIVLRNLYVEKTPLEPNQMAFLPRPALASNGSVGSGPSRGVFQRAGFLSGSLFAVSGNQIYNGNAAIGAVPGSGDVAMAAALNVLLIANGTNLYTSDGANLATVAFPDGAGVSDVAYIGGYAVAARAGSRRIYFTLDPTTWDGLDYIAGEQGNDAIVGFAIVSGQLWTFFETHTEIFGLTGNADAPLQTIEGRVFDKGALTRSGIVNLDNTVFWPGNDGIVYRGAGTPQRVSDHGIEERIAESDTGAVSAWAFPWKGHLFYVLHTEAQTVAYDVATQEWTEFSSFALSRWRAVHGGVVGRDVIAGDSVSGQLWKLVDDVYADADKPIERLWTVLIDEPGFVYNLTFDCSEGQRPSPNDEPGILEMRTSRDQGRTWQSWRQKGLGRQGAYRARAGFNRVGMVDRVGMTVQFRLTDPVPSTIRTIKVNEGQGGRAR